MIETIRLELLNILIELSEQHPEVRLDQRVGRRAKVRVEHARRFDFWFGIYCGAALVVRPPTIPSSIRSSM